LPASNSAGKSRKLALGVAKAGVDDKIHGCLGRGCMLRRAYDWMVSFANHPNAPWVLFWVTFLESSFSPLPPIPLLIPMCLAAPHKAIRYAMICAAGAIAGGYLGYAIGFLLYDTVGQWILAIYGLTDKAQELVQDSQKFWFWVLLTKGLTPIPFKIVTIMSGFIHFDLLKFTVGVVVSRVSFFLILVVAMYFYGENIRLFIERHLPLATLGLVAIIVGGFFVLPLIL
jgi:membrane protein YqaA with SNARE-associated domain